MAQKIEKIPIFKLQNYVDEKFEFDGVFTLTRTDRSANNMNVHLFWIPEDSEEEIEEAFFAFTDINVFQNDDGYYYFEKAEKHWKRSEK